MNYDFDKVHDRMGSDCLKWEKQLKFGRPSGLLPFWIADTDFATLPETVEAMAQRLEGAQLLDQGLIYNDILQRTGASSATISRVNRALQYGADGYKTVLPRLEP